MEDTTDAAKHDIPNQETLQVIANPKKRRTYKDVPTIMEYVLLGEYRNVSCCSLEFSH